ncbi:MAG: STAS domain-containing protein [Planctomycetia bacterium]
MDIAVVELKGGIADFPLLIQAVDGLMADGHTRIVIDLGTLPFMNSSALGYLIKTRATLVNRGGQLGLARLQQAIRNILAVTNLESLFACYDSVDSAVMDLARKAQDAGTPVPHAGPTLHRLEVRRPR